MFDESHSPYWDNYITTQYNNFSTDMIAQGYTVEAMATWTPATIMSADIFVTVTPSSAYTSAERALLHEFVAHGGGLFIIGDRQNVGSGIAGYFKVTMSNDPLSDLNDYIIQDYWVVWNRSGNFGDHPITAGVSQVETYLGDGLLRYPMESTPLLITDADDLSRYDTSGNVASGVAGLVAFEYHLGLGRIVVSGDGDCWTRADTDSDGTTNYFDSDNEILARNIIHWLAHPVIPEKTIIFDESHTPFYSIQVNPVQIDVLFDETHTPWNVIDADNDGIFGYEDDFSGFGDFAQILEGAGFGVNNMTSWSASTINAHDVLVFVRPSTDYTAPELDAIEAYVVNGGSVLIIAESAAFLTPACYQLARTFGVDFYAGVINDTDDYDTFEYWPTFSGTNLANHPAMNGVDEITLLHATALNMTPANAIPLIRTDNDATAGWDTTPPGNPSGQNLPVAVAFEYGRGRVVITPDMSHWYNDTGNPLLAKSNNALFGINVIRWLGQAGFSTAGYYDVTEKLQSAGYGVKAMLRFDPAFMATGDALVLVNSMGTYNASELNSMKQYVDIDGHGILTLYDWDIFGYETGAVALEFGFRYAITDQLLDLDNNTGSTGQILFDSNNFATHPITDSINDIAYLGGTGFWSIPGSAVSVVSMDSDSNSQWANTSSAAGICILGALESGRGRFAGIGDMNIWDDYVFTSHWGDHHTVDIDLLDNARLLVNTMDWLTANRAPLVHVDSPNGGEVLNSTITISWTMDDFDGDSLFVDVFVSPDDGGSWLPIATSLTNTSIQWNTATVFNGDQYRIRVVVEDGLLISEDISDNTFTIANPIIPPIPLWLIGLAAIIIVVVIIIVLFVLRRRASPK
ncbi:MAG: hypothetical protein Q6364_01310 [Candidatus Hermodarchaeota archaeon]|nr:hypothetical protein [Candidatus Hermodarchaeota archaeon]